MEVFFKNISYDGSFISQCDGNDSILDEPIVVNQGQHISFQVGFRPSKQMNNKRGTTRVKIKANNKINTSSKLPSVMNINPRSVYNKIKEFHDVVEEYEIDFTFS